MISVSGIRGKIPEGLYLENILLYVNSYIETLRPKKIVLGRDSRPSGLYIEQIVTGVLLSKGIDVIQIGIVPTPTLKAVVNATRASGGIMISASHNPIVWNAFKFVGKNGFFFNQAQMDSVVDFARSQKFSPPMYLPKSELKANSREFIELHIESVLKRVDVARIKKRKFSVLLDSVNGGGSIVVPALLEKLGCKVTKLYCEPGGVFPREPEPTPRALVKTARALKKSGAEIGFALDPDADRLVVLTPLRGCISEEYTLPLSVYSVLPDTKLSNLVVNLSTSFITGEIIEPYQKSLVRSKVGEANVVADMQKTKAFFGGEGNGGVIDPEINSYGRDSLSGIAHILNMLARDNARIDHKLDTMPSIFMDKQAFSIKGKDLKVIFNKIRDRFHYAKFDTKDGLWVDFGSSWLHVRASNTEPIVRVIAEAKTQEDLQKIFSQVGSLLK